MGMMRAANSQEKLTANPRGSEHQPRRHGGTFLKPRAEREVPIVSKLLWSIRKGYGRPCGSLPSASLRVSGLRPSSKTASGFQKEALRVSVVGLVPSPESYLIFAIRPSVGYFWN